MKKRKITSKYLCDDELELNNESFVEMIQALGPKVVYYYCICKAWKYYKASQESDYELNIQKGDSYINKAIEIEKLSNKIERLDLWQEYLKIITI